MYESEKHHLFSSENPSVCPLFDLGTQIQLELVVSCAKQWKLEESVVSYERMPRVVENHFHERVKLLGSCGEAIFPSLHYDLHMLYTVTPAYTAKMEFTPRSKHGVLHFLLSRFVKGCGLKVNSHNVYGVCVGPAFLLLCLL